jgi:hypothetical protein
MASLTTSTISALGGKLVVDISISGGNPNNNVTSATSGRIYLAQIDNTANSSAVYVKIRDNASASPGTSTANGTGTPHMMLFCGAYKKISYAIPGGYPYTAGVSIWCPTSATVGNTTEPSNDVIVKLVCS